MLPKPGDASVASNWRPIAILKVTYKIFSKMLCSRLQPLLESYQSPDQVGFRPHRGTDHAFAVFDTICGKSVEWNCNLWFASLDLKKAFDRMEHNALFAALAKQGVESSYLQLLKTLYLGQTGSVHGSRRFRITRGVKQGDVLSPLLFNAGLEAAIQSWKSRIADCGIHVGHTERLTNIRFADDLMVYSKSSSELAYMLEVFFLPRLANVLGRRPSLPQPDSVGTLTGRARICHLHVRDWLSRWPLPVQRDPRQPGIPREQHTIHATPTQDW